MGSVVEVGFLEGGGGGLMLFPSILASDPPFVLRLGGRISSAKIAFGLGVAVGRDMRFLEGRLHLRAREMVGRSLSWNGVVVLTA